LCTVNDKNYLNRILEEASSNEVAKEWEDKGFEIKIY
jgi:hypothetical protein